MARESLWSVLLGNIDLDFLLQGGVIEAWLFPDGPGLAETDGGKEESVVGTFGPCRSRFPAWKCFARVAILSQTDRSDSRWLCGVCGW